MLIKMKVENFFVLILVAVFIGMFLGYTWDTGQVAGL